MYVTGSACMSKAVRINIGLYMICPKHGEAVNSTMLTTYSAVISFGSSDTVIGRLEQPICPPLQPVTDVDCDAPLNGINGGPVLGGWDGIPDIANFFQVWVLIYIFARGDLKSYITCGAQSLAFSA